ncbi:uncharacterized protein [Periplaneta americana]|uniref:uncharacterized protein n=1 Tax=Periplaneta americana TaxID=6978 RepID=UPI0037E8F6E6
MPKIITCVILLCMLVSLAVSDNDDDCRYDPTTRLYTLCPPGYVCRDGDCKRPRSGRRDDDDDCRYDPRTGHHTLCPLGYECRDGDCKRPWPRGKGRYRYYDDDEFDDD